NITEEKNKLVKDGLIKKSKLLPEFMEPFQIPNNWKWVYLQDLSAYIQRGKSPKYTEKSNKIVISQKCVRWNGLDISPARFIDPKSLENYEKVRFLKDGDILWNSTGTGTIGRASLFFQVNEYQDIVADSHVTVVRTLGNISDYIYLVIRSPYIQKDLESSATGTTNQIELNTSTVLQTKIPLPPIEEQKRIVEKVDELMQLCDQLEQQQNLGSDAHDQLVDTLLNFLTNSSDIDEFQQNWQRISENFDLLFTTEYSIEQLKQTILQLAVMGKLVKQDPNDEAASELLKQITEEKNKLVKDGLIKKSKLLPEFMEPFQIPNNWKWVYLQDLSAYIQRGKSPKYTEKSNKIVISQKCVRWNGLDISPARFIDPKSLENYEKVRFLKDGDILWNSTGTGTIGRASLFFQVNEYQDIVADSHVTVVRTLGNISDYIYLVIRSPYIQKDLESSATGTTNQIELNTSTVLQTKIPLPPIEEQKRIVEKVKQLFSMIEQLQILQGKLQRTKIYLADSLVANAMIDSNDKSKFEVADNIAQFKKPIEVIKQSRQKSADQIDLFADDSGEDDIKLLSLAAEITFQLHTEPTFGHLKLQKLVYLCQQLKHMDLAADFKQHAAGPYDPAMARYLDKEFKNREWFSYDPKRDLKYKPLSRCNDHRSAFNRYFAEDVSEIYDLIGLFRASKSDHIEIVATLFACWLRLLEKKLSVTEEQLLKDFYTWSEEKKRFSKAEVLTGYKWMHQYSVIPQL
ncbi:restriction endonuclease subunit S, partial [Acinetobacter pittii]|uniref:restriction endonuclease subunit S n=1 Tax=Acinetobacter pittii TaxID=48296 RepID=UPI001023779D